MSGLDTFAGRIRPLQRVEYDRMVEMGLFADEKVELIKGFIVRMSPQNVPHASVVQSLTQLLVEALATPGRAAIRVQLPLAASDDSEPEPDVAVVAPGAYRAGHPTTAFFIIEVADSSLRHDRGEKAEVYAAAGIEEYWIVNTRNDLIEVHTDIVDGLYTRVTPFRRGQTIAPRAFPDVEIQVDAVLG